MPTLPPPPTLDPGSLLPAPLPTLSTGGLLPTPIPTLSTSGLLPTPTPSLPIVGAVLATPTPSAAGGLAPPPALAPAPATGSPSPAVIVDVYSQPVAARSPGPPPGAAFPTYLPLPPGPAGTALALALMVLPTLAVIWLLLLVRTLQRSADWRGSALRLAIAAELGVRPRELAGMPVRALRSLRAQLAFDEVTHVLNRPAGLAALERELARARRSRSGLAVVFVDLDGLKTVNDSRGHAAGDQLLKRAGSVLTTGLRTEDLVFRFGGDEFVCVLPGAAAAEAEAVMARIGAEAARRSCPFSYGVAELESADDEVALLGRADERLYEAKRSRPGGRRAPAARAPLGDRLRRRD